MTTAYPTSAAGRTALGLVAAAAMALLLALPTAASARDRNDDGIPDRWEKRQGLSLKVDQARRDQDHDHLGNRREFKFGFDPRDDDSDDDGIADGNEGSGVISAFDPETGSLTITLLGGESVTGLVTDATEVECDDGDDHGDEDGDGEGEDHSGPGHGEDDDDVDDDSSGSDDGEPDAKSDSGEVEDDADECGVDALVVGAKVQEAELEIEGGLAVWEEIELIL